MPQVKQVPFQLPKGVQELFDRFEELTASDWGTHSGVTCCKDCRIRKNAFESLKEYMQDREERIKDLGDSSDQFEKELSNCEDKLKKAEDQLDENESKITNLEQEVDDKTQECYDKENLIDELNQEIEDLNIKISELGG